MEDFHSSLRFDKRLYREDIVGSIAHARMLGKQGIISPEEADKLVAGLQDILADIEEGRLEVGGDAEDIHSFVEAELTKRLGPVGGRLHTARSRNDQVATDMRLFLREKSVHLALKLVELMNLLLCLAEEHCDTIMPGYTHLQPAQPVLLAHHLMAYFEMFERDVGRLLDGLARLNQCPLGSGALAGVAYDVDRHYVAEELGFAGPCRNSMDAVSDRDFCIEFAAVASLVMMHLSRFCEELVLWSTNEFAYVEMDDAFATGSSIMPQKKNPDAAELIRGKTGRVYGHLVGLLTLMKGLPLAYNKDMQEDKEAVFDIVDTLEGCLSVFIPMLHTLEFDEQAMCQAAGYGFLTATDLADYLTRQGVPFRQAHEIVGRLVLHCLKSDKDLHELELWEIRRFAPGVGDEVKEVLRPEGSINSRNHPGGTGPKAVKCAIEAGRQRLADVRKKAIKASQGTKLDSGEGQ